MVAFSCGQYDLTVSGLPRLLDRFRSMYKAYLKATGISAVAHLCLRIETLPAYDLSTNGWVYKNEDDYYRCTYFDNSKCRFEIRVSRNTRIIDVIFPDAIAAWFSVAIHYATMIALVQWCIGVHGVTVICEGQVIVLSAASGTGKTTLAKLLNKYCKAAVVNGDFALLSANPKATVVFEPTPFCGSSKTCVNYRLPVHRIVFLEQAVENKWEQIEAREALKLLLSNSYVPDWDESGKQSVIGLASEVVNSVRISRFSFAPNEEATRMFCDFINK